MHNSGALRDKRTVSRGAMWSAADFWLQQTSQLLTFIIVGNLLGPRVVGVITMALTAVLFLTTFIMGGFADALIQRAELRKDHFDTAFWLLLGIGLASAGLLVGSAPFIALFFSEPQLNDILPIFALALPFIAITASFQGMLQRELRFQQLALRSMIAYSTGFAVAVFLALKGAGVYSLVIAYLVSKVLDAGLVTLVAGIRPGTSVTRAALADIVNFGKHRVGHQVVGFFISQLDRVVIGVFLGPVALGLFVIAERMITALTNGLTGVVTRVAFPVLSSYQNDWATYAKIVRQFITSTNMIALPIFLGLAVAGSEVFDVLLSESWQSAAPLLKILCFAGLIHPLTWIFAAAANALGRSDIVFRNALVVLAFRVVAGLIAAQVSVLAVAVANVSVVFLTPFVLMAMTHKLFQGRWPYFFADLWAPLAAATAMVAATLVVGAALGDASPLLRLTAKVATGVATYTVGIRIFAPRLYRTALNLIAARS